MPATSEDLIYTDARRAKIWRTGQRRMLNGVLVSVAELAELAGCSMSHARRQCIDLNMDPQKFINRCFEKREAREARTAHEAQEPKP